MKINVCKWFMLRLEILLGNKGLYVGTQGLYLCRFDHIRV